MQRPLAAIDGQLVRLGFSKEFIGDIVIGSSSIDRGYGIGYPVIGKSVSGIDIQLLAQHAAFYLSHTFQFHIRNFHCGAAKIYRLHPGKVHRVLLHSQFYHIQQGILFPCRLIAVAYEFVYVLRREAEHIQTHKVGPDVHIRKIHIVLIGFPSQHIHTQGHHIGYVAHGRSILGRSAHVHTYYYVRSDISGYGSGIIVPHPSVSQDHILVMHRGENARNGHSGTESCNERPVIPYLGLSRSYIGRYACEWNRKVHEIHRVLIAYGQGAEEIIDILPEDITGRKASEQIVLHGLQTTSGLHVPEIDVRMEPRGRLVRLVPGALRVVERH